MVKHQEQIQIQTNGRGTTNITVEIQQVVGKGGIDSGLVHLFLMHTSASIILCENAAPEVRTDLETFMSSIVQDGDPAFLHSDEGPDDMSAHIRSILTTNDMTLPVIQGRLALGVWQGVFLWEHRNTAHRRTLVVTVSS